MGKDIVSLKANTKGKDFIIGDVHGNHRCLSKVIDSLHADDRLFIVGDLTDRGHDSDGVIDLVVKNSDRVFSARGNHESECLHAIDSLEELALKGSHLFKSERFKDYLKGDYYNLEDLFDDFDEIDKEDCVAEYEKITFDLENERLWLVDLFCYEMRHNYIRVNDNFVEYRRGSHIKQISDYMKSLPYIIHVAGERPFNVVHADMPFDNSVLMQRIRHGNLQLSEEEKAYAPWARGDSKHPFLPKSNSDGVITYVGHNIIEGNDLPIVRRESNTVNLDVATYDIDASLVVNHSDKCSQFIGKIPPKNLIKKQGELNEFLVSASENKATKRKFTDSSTSNFDSTSSFFAKRRRLNPDVQVHIDVKPNNVEISMDTDVEISVPKIPIKITL